MNAGFSSYAMGWATGPRPGGHPSADAAAVVETAIELGYRRVQLADNVSLSELTPARRAALKRGADLAGVAIEIGARGLTTENLARHLQIAAEFASPFLRIVIDTRDHEPDADEVIRLLRAEVKRCAQAGIVLAIENHDRFKPRELARIIRQVGSRWVGICLDTANSLGAGEGLDTVLRELGTHTVNVHLKDVRIERVPSLQGFTITGTPLGAGQLDLVGALRKLRRHGRCLSATLEHWVPPEKCFSDTLRKEREWCLRSTVKMRELFPEAFRPARR